MENDLGEVKRIMKVGYNPLCFADSVAFYDKERYSKYKENKGKGAFLPERMDIHILELLERIGFPMEEKGTYLYKELILEVYEKIQSGVEEKELLSELKDKFSNIYTYVSQEWLEINQVRYLNYLEDATKKIQYRTSDKKLARKLYKSVNPTKDYGVLAYKIAKYYQLVQKENKRVAIGRFNATSYNDQDINFIVYNDNTIDCPVLDMKGIRRMVLKPRFELISEDFHYTYRTPNDGKYTTSPDLIKEYNIEEDLFDYLKSHEIIRYSTEMAYLYDFKDKEGYDAKEKTRAYKWKKSAKSLELRREGKFD